MLKTAMLYLPDMKKSIIYLVATALVGLFPLNSCEELGSWVPGIDITDGDDNKEDEEKQSIQSELFH